MTAQDLAATFGSAVIDRRYKQIKSGEDVRRKACAKINGLV